MTAPKPPTQRDRVLARLRAAGSRGVTPDDFLLPHVIDDGKPILRLAARVHELVEAGEPIQTRREPNGVTRYVLEHRAPPPPAPARKPTPAVPSNADGTVEQTSIFDVLADAA